MGKIEWIFFDVGSTIVDESECCRLRCRAAVEGTEIPLDEFVNKVIEFSKHKLKGDHEAARFFGIKLPPWPKEAERPYDCAEGLLRELHAKYRLGIIANQSPGTRERLKNWGLLKYFDVVAASAEEGVAKPDPEIFRRALSAAKCLPQHAVMIGDRLDNDIAPAKKIGMKTVWVRQGLGGLASTVSEEERADYVVDGLDGVRGIFGGDC